MGEKITMVSIEDIKPHPRNTEFFDDITGEKWEDFVESIRVNGILEPLILTQDMVTVSGNQRHRGGIEVGLMELPCIIRQYNSETEVIKDLIEINLQQRGVISGSKRKQGAIAKALEEAYGVKNGMNQYTKKVGSGNSTTLENPDTTPNSQKTQADIAASMGLSLDQYKAAIAVTKLIPELQEMTDDGRIPASAAQKILTKLTEDEQLALVKELPITEKMTSAQIQSLTKKLCDSDLKAKQALEKQQEAEKKAREAERKAAAVTRTEEEYQKAKADLEAAKQQAAEQTKAAAKLAAEKQELQERLAQTPTEKEVIIEKEVQVIPPDYEDLKLKAKEAERISELEKEIEGLKVDLEVKQTYDALHKKEEPESEGFRNAAGPVTVEEPVAQFLSNIVEATSVARKCDWKQQHGDPFFLDKIAFEQLDVAVSHCKKLSHFFGNLHDELVGSKNWKGQKN